MHVMAREAWTDDRLDDLTKHMDANFQEVRADMRQQREQTTAGREELGELRAEIKGLEKKMDERFDSLNRTLQITFSLIGVVLAGLMGLIGTQL